MLALLYVVAGVVLVQGIFSLLDGFRFLNFVRAAPPRRSRIPQPAVVFCPCKGADEFLEGNLRSLLVQDHPNYRVVFIVESGADPAHPIASRVGDVLVAGPAVDRGQKVHSLTQAVTRCSEDAEVFVFCDSDARFPTHWLSSLVGPLEDPRVGATTGYRWLIPETASFPALLVSAWNASIVTVLGPHRRNFAWGGSMALRRETFERIGVMGFWRGCLSDDYAVTRAVRAAGLDLVFVPSCLVPASDRSDWKRLLEFTTRQMKITRLYAPRVWKVAFVAQSVHNLAFWGLAAQAIFNPIALLLFLAIYTLSWAKAAVRLRAVRLLVDHASLGRLGWFYCVAPPMVALLYQWNLLASAFGRTIDWKGVRYTVVSSNEVYIHRREACPRSL